MPSTADQVDAAGRRSGLRADLAAVAAGALLVVAAAVVGRMLLAQGVDLLLPFPPLLAQWLPHAGPGTPVAVVVAVAVVAWGPALAAALPWPRLLAAAWAAAVVWTLGLALVDGWQRGVVERLSSGEEYLHDVPRVDDVAGDARHVRRPHPDRPAGALDHARRARTRPGCCCSTSRWTGSAWAAAARPGW